ncbi:MAG: YafY family transcriptional regulator [Lachnospiraceae bacterium]|nr:YafY family protein [uncultured Acetatifactor sp.]MCI9571594.1 YafY family transcriptional regulator [Lachnospiraceae bacterium]
MSKAERLIEMMITINAKRDFTVGELAKEFSVSKRTILRDLQELEQAGFPLYAEVGAAGGYHILKERILPPIAFSESEAKAIFFACQALKYYRDLPFEQETISVLKKFLNCLPLDVQNGITQIQNKVVFWIPDRHCDSPLLKEMFLVAVNRHAATIRYSSTHSESIRTIVPIGLYAMNGLWYCPAYCTAANRIRTFRVDRIREIIEEAPCPKGKYPIPGSIQEYLENTEAQNDHRLKIRLTDIGVKRCESECLLAGGLKTLPTGGGMIDMEIDHAALEWVADYILPFGKEATVLEPEELLERMRQKIRELHRQYCVAEQSGAACQA